MITGQADPAPGTPNLVLPAQPPRDFAIHAFRSARTTDPGIPSALPAALAAHGIGVITLDLRVTPAPPPPRPRTPTWPHCARGRTRCAANTPSRRC